MSFFGCAGATQPSGFQPGAGTRTIQPPTIMKTKIDDAERDEGLGDSDMRRRREAGHQPHRERRGDEGGAAEAHDCHARGHAGSVGNHLISVETGEM